MFINEPHFLTQAQRINLWKEDYANRQKGHPALHGGVARGGGRTESSRWQDILQGVQLWPWQPSFQQLSIPLRSHVEQLGQGLRHCCGGWGSSFLTVVYGDLRAWEVGGEEMGKEELECNPEGPLVNTIPTLHSGGMESGHEAGSK